MAMLKIESREGNIPLVFGDEHAHPEKPQTLVVEPIMD